MSRRNNYTVSNRTTSVNTQANLTATEETQKQVLSAIKDIEINVGEIVLGDITVESNDSGTHTRLDTANGKLDTLNTTIVNKHLTTTDDSVTIGNVLEGVSISVNNFPDNYATETTAQETNTKLDNLETSLTEANETLTNILDKHLSSAADSVEIPPLDFSKDTVSVVSSKVVESVTYDLNNLGATLYADSINSAIVDPNGREGWYWTNGATTGGSNLYWYSNSLVPQNNMTKAQAECIYTVMALDRVQPTIVLPIVAVYSKPEGAGDFIPTFARSRWVYTIPATNVLNAGEVVMLTIGDHTKISNIHPELRRVHLELAIQNGPALDSETIAYISLNTDSAPKDLNAIQYLVKNAGFYYSITEKAVDYEFKNSLERLGQLNKSGAKRNSDFENIYTTINTTNDSLPLSVNSNNELITELSNFPTSFEISNFPTTVEISNFPASFEISNFPTSVEITSLPDIAITNTTFEISNFPTSTEVSNFPASFEISNFPTSVEITSLPDIAITNTSFEISNFPTTVEISNFPTSVEVTSLPDIGITNTSFEVSNFPTTYALESGGNLASIKSNTDKIKNDTTNTDAIQVQVKNTSLTVNTISGFALDTTTQSTNTKLDTIHTDLDGLTYDGSSNLNVNVAAGSLTVDSVKIKDSAGNNLNSTSNALNTFLTNTSVPVSGSVSVSNLPTFTNSHTQAFNPSAGGAYFDITSTTIAGVISALDVAIKNTSIPVTSASNLDVNMNDFAGNSITSDTFTFNGSPKNGLDVAIINNSSNPIPVSGSVSVNTISGFALDSSVGTTNDRLITTNSTLSNMNSMLTTIHNDLDPLTFDGFSSLNVNIANTDVPVSGTVTSRVRDSAGNSIGATSQSLHTFDYNINLATDIDGNVIKTLGVAKNGGSFVNVTCDNNGFQNVVVKNSETTNNNSTTGLNVYQILPKVKHYTMGGFDSQSSVYRLFGLSTTNGINTTSTHFGFANPRVHYGILSSGQTGKNLFIDYVDVNGMLIENAGPYALVNNAFTTLPTMISPVSFRMDTNLTLNSAEAVYITITNVASGREQSVAGMDLNQYCVGTFTIPNGYIGYLSSINSLVVGATGIQVVKWDVDGIRKVAFKFNNTSYEHLTSGYEGSLGGIFYPGETIAFSNQSAVAGKSCFGNIVLKSIM